MALPDNSVGVSPLAASISLPRACGFTQAAQPPALPSAQPSRPFPFSSHATEIMTLMLLVDHSQNCRGLKGRGIPSVVLRADICSPAQGGQQQGWALAPKCCPGTRQWLFSCLVLRRRSGLAAHRGFVLVSHFGREYPVLAAQPGTLLLEL